MDFFGHQEQARRNTAILVALFILAVALIVVAVYLAVVGSVVFGQVFISNRHIRSIGFEDLWNLRTFGWVTLATLSVITAASLWRMHALRQGGGAAVAEMLGGVRVTSAKGDARVQRLLNVVEEMAIASGLPVPPVYLLEERGINAFAAGFSPSDAVIGVTKGALAMLDRDQLQGVIAHEFSHILNGDSRLKMRLMGLLFGIMLISDAGIAMMTARNPYRYTSTHNPGSVHPAAWFSGMLLFSVGLVGLVLADLIKRAVSRQREFLADAAAVQFTRNPAGLAGALKIIGGYRDGARIRHAKAREASHFFFGNALNLSGGRNWWATHPPLTERIRRLDPSFLGHFERVDSAVRSSRVLDEASSAFAESAPSVGTSLPATGAAMTAGSVVKEIGNPTQTHLREARRMLERIPSRLKKFVHDPYTARAVVYALLLDTNTSCRSKQLKTLQQSADANVFRETLDIQPLVARLSPELRLPLLDMVLPALKSLSRNQYDAFRKNVNTLIEADQKITLFEYTLHRILLRHLHRAFVSPQPEPVRFPTLSPLRKECACVLAMMLRFGSSADIEKVFGEAMTILKISDTPSMPDEASCQMAHLDRALRKLAQAAPNAKRRLIEACAHCMLADGKVNVREMEMLRAVAEALDCPMPPLSIKTHVSPAEDSRTR